jgi:hypothetical protein
MGLDGPSANPLSWIACSSTSDIVLGMDSALHTQGWYAFDPFYETVRQNIRTAKGKLLKGYLSVGTGRDSRRGRSLTIKGQLLRQA